MHSPRLVPLALLLALATSCTGIPGTHCHALGRGRSDIDALLAEMAEDAGSAPMAEGDEIDLDAGDVLGELTVVARRDGDPALTGAVHELSHAYDDFDRPAFQERLTDARSVFDAKIREDCLGE